MTEEAGPAAFSDRELDIMSVLWREGSGTVAEVRDRLPGQPGYTTVLKFLQILEEKGAVRHEPEGRAYRYFPLVERADAGGRALRRILDKVFHGSAELLLARLVTDTRIPDEEIARMRRILEAAPGEGVRGGEAGAEGEAALPGHPRKATDDPGRRP